MKTIKMIAIVGSLLLIVQVFTTHLPAIALAEEEAYSDSEEQGFVPEEEIMEEPSYQYEEEPMEEERASEDRQPSHEPDPLPLGDPMYTPEGLPRGG